MLGSGFNPRGRVRRSKSGLRCLDKGQPPAVQWPGPCKGGSSVVLTKVFLVGWHSGQEASTGHSGEGLWALVGAAADVNYGAESGERSGPHGAAGGRVMPPPPHTLPPLRCPPCQGPCLFVPSLVGGTGPWKMPLIVTHRAARARITSPDGAGETSGTCTTASQVDSALHTLCVQGTGRWPGRRGQPPNDTCMACFLLLSFFLPSSPTNPRKIKK